MATILINTTVALIDPATVPIDIQSNWFNGLTLASKGKIQNNWNKIAGTDVLWKKNVATISHLGYQDFPNPDPTFTSRKDRSAKQIVAMQLRKLTAAATDAKTKFDLAFQNDGADYVVKVNNSAGKFSKNMIPTLTAVGSRVIGARGAVTVHVRAVCQDFTWKRDAQPGWVTGDEDPTVEALGEVPYIWPGRAGAYRAAMEGMMVRHILAQMAGDYDDTLLAAANVTMTKTLQHFLVTGRTGNITLTGGAGGFTLVTSVTGVVNPPVPTDPIS